MRVKLKVSRAGVDASRGGDGAYSQNAGELIDVGDAEGNRMIAANLAARVDGPTAEIETTSRDAAADTETPEAPNVSNPIPRDAAPAGSHTAPPAGTPKPTPKTNPKPAPKPTPKTV